MIRPPRGLLPALLLPALVLQPARLGAQGQVLSDIQDRRLGNGLRVVVVERSGGGAVHARLFVKLPGRPSAMAHLVAHALFGASEPEATGEAGAARESLLLKEEGLREELRLARLQAARGAAGPPQGLQEARQEALAALRRILEPVTGLDAVDALGGARREILVAPDHLVHGVDLPAAALAAWCAHLAGRIQEPRLLRLPLVREALGAEAATLQDPARSAFLSVAYPGHPYGQGPGTSLRALEAAGLEETRAFARATLQPESMALVLVGDVAAEALLPALEASLGALVQEPRPTSGDPAGEEAPPGARRLQATLPGPPRLLLGWRLPPRSHPDHLGLQVLAKLLAGGPSARLRWTPLEARGVLASLRLTLGEPGAREGGMLLLEAAPEEGHSLAEVEQALLSEVMRLQQEPIREEEALGAQRQVLAEALRNQEDAAGFAQALGEAWSQAGHWQAALADPGRLRTWGPEELRRLARTHLAADRSVVAHVEPDLLTSEEDPLDVRLVEAVRGMARRSLQEPAKVEALVRQTIRQLRMLPRAERERVLDLLAPSEVRR